MGNYEILRVYMNPVENHIAYRIVLIDLQEIGVQEYLLIMVNRLLEIEEKIR